MACSPAIALDFWRLDTVFRNVGGEAGGDLLVKVEELGEEIGLGGEAVGGEYGGIQRGVGVLERIGAGEFEGAIERAQPALELRKVCSTDAADFPPGRGDCGDGFLAWILRPCPLSCNRASRPYLQPQFHKTLLNFLWC